MAAPLDIWFDHFTADPDGIWREYVAGRLPIPGYERADAADTLHWVFGARAPEDPVRQTLDTTLVKWLDEFLAWDDAQRRRFGLSSYVFWLVEVMNAASLLKLPRFTQHVYDHVFRYRGMLTPLLLAPHRDPLAALYWLLSGTEAFAPFLRLFWLRMCQEADSTQPDYYVEIALRGLRQLPVEAGHTPPWLVGLACWLPRVRSKDAFVNTFRTLKAMYPRGPDQWRNWVEPLLENLKERVQDPNRLSWWKYELGQGAGVGKKYKILESPYPEEMDRVFDQFQENQDRQQLGGDLEVLLRKYESYLEASGDRYYYIRAVSKASDRILKRGLAELVPMALAWTRRALVVEPWDIPNWHIHGRCLAFLEMYQAAEYVYWETLRRKRDHIPSMGELGLLLGNQERFAEAEAILQQALSIDSDNQPVRNLLGLLLRRMGRLDEAETLFLESSQSFSWNPEFKKNLDIVRAQKRGKSVPPVPQHGSRHDVKTVVSLASYAAMEPAAMSKRHDFFMSDGLLDEGNALRQQAREGLTALVRSDGQQAAVRFYGRRHGLIRENEEIGELQWACRLDRASPLDPAALQDLAQHLPKKLADLVRVTTGDMEAWRLLTAWQEREEERQKRTNRQQILSYLDQFVWEKVTGWLKEGQEPPPPEKIFPILKDAAEIVAPVATAFLVA